MQYILSQDELDNLIPKSKEPKYKCALSIARGVILTESSFICIHDRKESRDYYCDKCPLGKPFGDSFNSYKLICTRERNYSK